MNENQKAEFENKRVLDFSFAVGNQYRFRGHLYFQKGTIGGAFRCIPSDIPQLKTLGLPSSVFDMPRYPHGLVLVTGPTGSGKSTTLAAMVKEVNNIKRGLIVTVEDPIEYVHTHDKMCDFAKRIGYRYLYFWRGAEGSLKGRP